MVTYTHPSVEFKNYHFWIPYNVGDFLKPQINLGSDRTKMPGGFASRKLGEGFAFIFKELETWSISSWD